ncbi:MAG: hypothetical protein EOP04_23335 [Proteobacteria bacterium]|nr:MAG: hypothetical protein EOP04_23335 [Pseudomonadota bacterium]
MKTLSFLVLSVLTLSTFSASAKAEGRSLDCHSTETGSFQLQFGNGYRTSINGQPVRRAKGGGLLDPQGRLFKVDIQPDSSVILYFKVTGSENVADFDFMALCN